MTALAKPEAVRLSELEATIDSGLKTFMAVGLALKEVRDSRLYRSTHANFDDYCSERWGVSSRHANRTIEASDVVEALGPIGLVPTNEAQARELVPLQGKPERMASAWQGAVERAQAEDRRVTASDVRTEVVSRRPNPAKAPSAPSSPPAPQSDPPEAIRATEPASSHMAERLDASCRVIREWSDKVDVESDPARWLPPLLAAQTALEQLVDRARLAADSTLSAEDLSAAKAMAKRLGVELR